MLNYLFVSVICLVIAISFGITCRYLGNKEWRKATFSGVLTLFTPLETFLFVQERDVMGQTEFTYFLEQIQNMNLSAFLILFLYLFVFSNIIYFFIKQASVSK